MTDFAEPLNQNRDGWNRAMGVHFTRVTVDEVVAEWTVGPEHLQAYGIVHGGVYSGVIETLASVGAAMNAMAHGQGVVGLENTTSFLHAVRGGKLTARATPIVRGRRTHVWEANVTDESGRVVATGRVRLITLESDAKLAGRGVAIEAKK
jgi:1,4-dihydroxy-2-naphthoyl-CoA hydrolase